MNQMLRPAQSHESIPLEALAGTVERVTYHNAENGFCVLKVQVRGKRDLVVVVGHAPSVGAGEWITASGAWVSDRTHGLQFKAGVEPHHLRSAPGHGGLWSNSGGFRLQAEVSQRYTLEPFQGQRPKAGSCKPQSWPHV